MIMVSILVILVGAFLATPFITQILGRNTGYLHGTLFFVLSGWLFTTAHDVFSGRPIVHALTWSPPLTGTSTGAEMLVNFAVRVDALSFFFVQLALIIGGIVFYYSARYLSPGRQLSFYLIMTGFMLSMVGLVVIDDLIVLFGLWELTSLASFLLIARSGSAGEAGAMRTLILTFIGGLTMLTAVSLTIAFTGTTSLSGALRSPAWEADATMTTVIAVLIAVSAFTKSAQFPFHPWLPEAMAAATPVSAFLHAAAVVKAGIYLLLRFSYPFSTNGVWQWLLITVGLGTAIMAALFATQKTDLKKLTAYSTVSQLGWIVATIGIGTPFALAAAALHTLAHAGFKSSLFMLIGVIDHEAKSRDIRRLGKLYKKMPLTFGAVVLGAASMAGIPPLLGFVSKESMLEALASAPGSSTAVVSVLIAALIGAVLTFTYSAKLVFGGFIDGTADTEHVHEGPLGMLIPAALPSLISLPILVTLSTLDHPLEAISLASGGTEPGIHLALWHGFTAPLGMSAVIIIAGVVLIWQRAPLYAALDRELLPRTGAQMIAYLVTAVSTFGAWLSRLGKTSSPTPHLLLPLLVLGLYTATVLVFPGIGGTPRGSLELGISEPMDVIPLILVAIGAVGTVRSTTRLGSTIMLSVAGIGVTLQILLLGAPDVALTQLLVEILMIVVIMLVIHRQPALWTTASQRRHYTGVLAGIGIGLVAMLGTWALTSHRGKSELAQWYLTEAPEVSGGDNVVNTILVEFRALDTLGELTVLGMAGIAIAAVIASVPRSPSSILPRSLPETPLNMMPLRQIGRIMIPILGITSALIFYRGHNLPGGGFIAALIGAIAITLYYLVQPQAKAISSRKLPLWLISLGILIALATGFIGYLHGSYLAPLHGYILGEHFSTSMIFDVGVYLAVIGLIVLGLNKLGLDVPPGSTEPVRATPHAADIDAPQAVVDGTEHDPDTYAPSPGVAEAAKELNR